MQKLDNTKDIKSLTIFDKKVTSLLTLNESILLNQVLYWASKCGREIAGLEGTWIYNSLKDWHKQFPYWSLSTLRRDKPAADAAPTPKAIAVFRSFIDIPPHFD